MKDAIAIGIGWAVAALLFDAYLAGVVSWWLPALGGGISTFVLASVK